MKRILLSMILASLLFWPEFVNAQQKSTAYYQQNASAWVDQMQNSDGNVFEAQKAFDTYWGAQNLKATNATKGKGYKVFKRWENFWVPRVYPSGMKPNPNIAMNEYNKFKASNPGFKSSTGANWSFMGPKLPTGTVPNGSYRSPGGAGRVNCVAFHPTNDNIIWIGTPAGGLWKSTNGGDTWSSSSDQFAVLGVSSIAINYNDPNIMYIGTGDRDAGDTYSTGILKSTDGGVTWNPTSVSFNVSQNARSTGIIMHPTNPNTMIASFNGVVYKTTDGWSTKTTVLSEVIFDLEFDPNNPSNVYAAGSKFFRSTNGGDSFTQVTSGLPSSGVQRYEIAVSPAAGNNVWVLAGQSSDQGFLGIYKSTNDGSSFSTLYYKTSKNLLGWSPTGNDSQGQAFYDLSFAVNPTNANEMIVGGVNLHKSTNGGTSWTCTGYWLSGSSYPYTHADHHCIEYKNGTTIFNGNDGGIFISTNNGASWTDKSATLAISQVARIGLSKSNANVIMTGMQDNGTNLYDGNTWKIVYGGDGCEAMVDPNNTNILYASYVNGKLYKSTNGGSSFSGVSPSTAGSGLWITPWVMHPTNSSTLYAGYTNLYRTTNGGSSWSKRGTAPGSGKIEQIAQAPSNPSVIYIFKYDRYSSSNKYTVGKTTNEGTSWTNISSGLPLSSAAPTYLAVDANDPNKVYITFSGYTAGEKVYMSTNGGSSWTNISSNLPNLPTNTIVLDKNNGAAYVGCDVGVYYKASSDSDWTLFNDKLPNVIIKELEIYYDNATPANSRLRAATYGRSVWESPLFSGTGGQTCGSISNLAAASQTNTAITLSWTGFAEASSYEIRYREVGTTSWTTTSTTSTSKTITGLTNDSKYYEGQVRSVCSEGTSSYSTSVNWGTQPIVYCESKGADASYEWIATVTIGSFTKSTGSTGYSDYTADVINLNSGASVAVSLTPGYKSTAYNEYWKIWIDYNKDGDFNDAGELAFDAGSMSKTTVTGNINVAANATGTTRMRVGMKYNAEQTSTCETYEYGEVEDYTVSFTAQTCAVVPANLAVSGIGTTGATLAWDAVSGVSSYDVRYKATAASSWTSVNRTTTSVDVTGLSPETEYEFQVRAVCSDGASTYSSSKTFTTDYVCNIPSGLAVASITSNSAALSWTSVSDQASYNLRYKATASSSWTSVNASNASHNLSGLTAETEYEYQVRTVCTSGTSNYSASKTFTTIAEVVQNYCESKGSNASYEWIDLVRLGTIDNTTGTNGGYGDFTSLSTNVTVGTQKIYLSAGFKSTNYTEYWRVYIDLNQDGDFKDSGEELVTGSSSSSGTLSADLTIPASAKLGTTRMRVSMKYQSAQTSTCETFSYGEVEDYTVNIVASGSVNFTKATGGAEELGNEDLKQFSIYPNPTDGPLNIAINGDQEYVMVFIYNMEGSLVKQVNAADLNGTLDISNLPNGTYTVVIDDNQKKSTQKIVKH